MSQRSALVARVLENPSADTPRLILADHLSAADDPRGEFITLQCASSSPRHRKRALALLRHHWRTWVGGLEPLLDERTVHFERGFLVRGTLRRVSVSTQTQVELEPWHALLAEVSVVRDTVPGGSPLVAVLPRLSGLQRVYQVCREELDCLIGEALTLTGVGLAGWDPLSQALLRRAAWPLETLRVPARDDVASIRDILGVQPLVTSLDVGQGTLSTWQSALREFSLDQVEVGIPGWRLVLTGTRLEQLEIWPRAGVGEDPTAGLIEALRDVALGQLAFIRLRGGRVPFRESIVALQRAAKGTPLLLPATWRHRLRDDA